MDLREERNTTYGSGNITYYFNETVTQTPYKEFSSIISGAAEQVIPLTVLKESTAVIAEYETPVGVPGTTEIIGGLWSLYLHFNAGSAGQNWIIRPAIYKRDSGGTETLVFTPDPVIVTDMNTTTEMYISDGVFPSTTLITTDRLVVRISVQNTRSVSQTISFRTEGSQHYSLASTTLNPVYNPLPILDLQSVTTIGNTTDTNIQFGTGVGVLLNNNSKLKEGTIDAGYGGTKGIAQICAVGYELKWEAGRLYVMGDGGTTIREVSHNFTTIPTAYDDVSKGFITGSRWILDNGDLYTCTDNTTDTATWELNNKIGGTGTTNYVSKFTSTGVIGDSLFQDNGSTTSINGSLDTNFQFIVYNSTRLHAISGINSKVGSADQVGILGTSNGAGTGKNIGVYGSTNSNSILNVGVYGLASGASATNIGGKFSGTGATNNYSLQLEDGTEGVGKVLTSMTSDGKAQWATAAGGLTYFTEAQNSTTPNATVKVDSLTALSSTTNADIAIVPKGTGAFTLAVPDNTTVGGNKRGINAVDLQTSRTNAAQVASGQYSFASGRLNTASGDYSTAMGVQNIASGGLGCLAIGYGSTASGSSSVATGASTASGATSFASGTGNLSSGESSIALGANNTSSGVKSFVCGNNSVASGEYSMVMGYYASAFGLKGRWVTGQTNTILGDAQKSIFILSIRTTDTTATTLTSGFGSGAPSAINQVILQNQNALRFKGTIIGKKSGTTDIAAWDVDGLIVRGANAAATTLVVSNVNLVSNTPAWGTPTLAADTTNGGLRVQAIGFATTNIQWTCTIETTEVIYA